MEVSNTIEEELRSLVDAVELIAQSVSTPRAVIEETAAEVTLIADTLQEIADNVLPLAGEILPIVDSVNIAVESSEAARDEARDFAELAENYAGQIGSTLYLRQYYLQTSENQVVLSHDHEDTPIVAIGGAIVELDNGGTLIPDVDYIINEEGAIRLTVPAVAGSTYKIITLPRSPIDPLVERLRESLYDVKTTTFQIGLVVSGAQETFVLEMDDLPLDAIASFTTNWTSIPPRGVVLNAYQSGENEVTVVAENLSPSMYTGGDTIRVTAIIHGDPS